MSEKGFALPLILALVLIIIGVSGLAALRLTSRSYNPPLQLVDSKVNEECIDSENPYLHEIGCVLGTTTIPGQKGEVLGINNTLPPSGYRRQQIKTSVGTFTLDIVAADLNSTRVIIDTASSGDCGNNCPVLPLGEYAKRSSAYAGVNGSYFCPASYGQCAGKTNSFDTLLMNKNKTYFNSDNNVYSTVPAMIFSPGSARTIGQSLEWGRDTSIDGMIANHPLMVSGGNVVFGGNGDPKQGSKGSRSFIGFTDNIVYIGVLRSATVAQTAIALKEIGVHNALNLDSGGSTALWSGGYKVGPGRSIPNAVLFVQR